jgi:hypothetical protein
MKKDLPNLYDRDYFLQKNQALNNLVASDLKKIVETVKSKMSGCVIVLGGSLAYGEGKYVKSGEDLVILSDYDLFVISPSLYKTLRMLTSKQFKNLLSKLNLASSLELVFVWEGALRLNLTTVAGYILAGGERGEKVLNRLSIPESANNLKRAFKFLLRGISETGNHEKFLRRGLVQAFQAFLLSFAKKENLRYEVWKNFYSLRYDLEAAENHKAYLGEHTYRLLKKILAEELRGEPLQQQLGFEEISVIKDFVNKLYLDSKPTLKINDYIRYLTFNMKDGRLPNPIFNSTQHFFDAVYLLLKSVEGIKRFNEGSLHEAEIILAKITGYKCKSESAQIRFKKLVERLIYYDESYLHKVKLTPERSSASFFN